MEIKKSSFFRNQFFSAKNKSAMQKYLNEMSANGMHISKISKFSCTFTEDASVQYVYSICGENEQTLYTENTGWSHFCNYKGVPFFRKTVPADAVRVTRNFKASQIKQEQNWLNTRLLEGLVLIAKIGDEYIFERNAEKKNFGYYIKKKAKNTKKDQVAMPFGDISDMIFVSSTDDTKLFYFIKDETTRRAIIAERGKRFSDQLLAIGLATGSALGFCAAIAVAIYSLIENGPYLKTILISCGIGAVVFALLFVIFFRRFQKITEARRIRKEEKLRQAELDAQNQAKSTEQTQTVEQPAGNTVVMNTVVMNNYGTDAKQEPSPFGVGMPNAQFFDPSISPALDPSVNPAIAAAKDPQALASAVINGVRYGQAADTLVQGEQPQTEDIWRENDFLAPPSQTYSDDDWVALDEPAKENFEESEDEDDSFADENQADGFPLLKFIGFAIICLASLAAAIVGLRYGIEWFIAPSQSNALTMVLSLLAIGFSPFTLRFGIISCKRILKEHSTED